MKKYLSILLLAGFVGVMVSCSQNLSPTPPKDVTSPTVVNTYQKAVNGDISSLKTIGHYYAYGMQGFPQSPRKSINCYQMAANLGDVESQWRTGQAYMNGKGRLSSNSNARKYLGMAAANGSATGKKLLHELEQKILKEEHERAMREQERKIKRARQERMQQEMLKAMFTPTYVVTPAY